MSGNASQRQGDRKSKEIPEAGEEENGSGPVEKAGKRFHLDHTGRRKLGNGFGNAAGQLGTKAGSKGRSASTRRRRKSGPGSPAEANTP